jgi:hypothetical protein
MKLKFAIIFLVILFGIWFNSFSQANKKDTLYVERIDQNILTVCRISCSHFATSFSSIIKFSTITNNDTINILKSYIGNIKYTKKYNEVDVRAKYIYESKEGSNIEICTDGYQILIEGRAIKPNDKFSAFLKSL